MPSSLPRPSAPYNDAFTRADRSADYGNISSSIQDSAAQATSAPTPIRREPLAFAGIRHRLEEDGVAKSGVEPRQTIGQCSQVVMISCLHLSHEAVQPPGRFAWTQPNSKEAAESTLRIMRRYAEQIAALARVQKIDVRKAPDPTREVIQHHVLKARMAAGSDSYIVAFYGGHGIQESPTDAGELWCYDKSFEEFLETGVGPSEYIPLLLFDYFSWCGSSSCYVWDCQKAGRFLKAAVGEAAEIDSQLQKAGENDPQIARLHPPVYSKLQIHFAACGAEESLPKVPGFPDDLFTSCLQTPLRVALLYHNFQTFPIMATRHDRAFSQRAAPYMEALYYSMSSQLKERLWKEMQALLSTIAWHVLDAERYQFLFGHNGDLISNLACGFLLAQRVMSTYHATPESIPFIPWSVAHSLWTTWDLMLDSFFEQLPPYFDEDVPDHTWEDDLRLVSFIGDQLEGVFTPDVDAAANSDPIAVMGMSRMPIMCSAALFPEHRQKACEALATCLPSLSLRDLAKAVQGGALDVALQLLRSEEDYGLAPQLISIWASLMRDPTSVELLSTEARSIKKVTDLATVKFFLDHLDTNLTVKSGEENRQIIVQTAAILATIANHVGGRSAPYFVARTLRLAGMMLDRSDDLAQQWGALLIAEITGSLEGAVEDEANRALKKGLLGLVEDESVDTRATAVYALARRIPIKPAQDIIELSDAVELTTLLLPLAQADGSPIVRKETVGISRRLLTNACCWTTLVLIIHGLQLAVASLPAHERACQQLMVDLANAINIRPQQREMLFGLSDILQKLCVLQHDPDMRVVKVTYSLITKMVAELKPFMMEDEFEAIFQAMFPPCSTTPVWSIQMVEVLKQAGLQLTADWSERVGKKTGLFEEDAVNNDLFETCKMSLQDHLSRHDEKKPRAVAKDKVQPGPSEKTYILRHRALEDAMIVAEQQVGLPWKWKMKDILATEPWTFIACHSFDNILLAGDDSHNVTFWDWGLARKTGSIKLNLAPGHRMTSARFVNELHPSNIVIAEISNGVMHVLSGSTYDPPSMRSISSFLALDVTRSNLAQPPTDRERGLLSSSWWRQTGRLVVGGASEDINVWDCPAERCVKKMKTQSDYMITRVIHEPVSGNIILTGFENGEVKLFDLRQNRSTSLLQWDGSEALPECGNESRNIRKVGMALGQSSHISSASANGMINIHDLRILKQPVVSVFAQPGGIASASYQAHSGLMSTCSYLNPPRSGRRVPNSLASLRPRVTFGMFRATTVLAPVTIEDIVFDPPPSHVVNQSWAPYTVMHPLRPWLGIGYGKNCHLRGSGVGEGDDTDSGSYSFLQSQGQLAGVLGNR